MLSSTRSRASSAVKEDLLVFIQSKNLVAVTLENVKLFHHIVRITIVSSHHTMSFLLLVQFADIQQGRKSSLNEKIKEAYRLNDKNASMKHHRQKQRHKGSVGDISETSTRSGSIALPTDAQEQHKGELATFMKSIIFGGLDGVLTVFAMVASISGSDLPVASVLVLGFAKLIAGGLSMGIGDFLSEKAEIDFVRSELERERWELTNFPKGEIEEMIEIYTEKGISQSDARLILTTMAKYPETFLQHMMVQELELDSNVIDDNPLKNGGVTFLSFVVFGTIPLLSYLIFDGIHIGPQGMLKAAIGLTLLTLFGMGAIKSYYCNQDLKNIIKSGLLVTMNGAIAAGSAYGFSFLVSGR